MLTFLKANQKKKKVSANVLWVEKPIKKVRLMYLQVTLKVPLIRLVVKMPEERYK